MSDLDTDGYSWSPSSVWLTDKAVERQLLGQGECKQVQREELASSPYLGGSERCRQRLHFGKVFEFIQLLSHVPR